MRSVPPAAGGAEAPAPVVARLSAAGLSLAGAGGAAATLEEADAILLEAAPDEVLAPAGAAALRAALEVLPFVVAHRADGTAPRPDGTATAFDRVLAAGEGADPFAATLDHLASAAFLRVAHAAAPGLPALRAKRLWRRQRATLAPMLARAVADMRRSTAATPVLDLSGEATRAPLAVAGAAILSPGPDGAAPETPAGERVRVLLADAVASGRAGALADRLAPAAPWLAEECRLLLTLHLDAPAADGRTPLGELMDGVAAAFGPGHVLENLAVVAIAGEDLLPRAAILDLLVWR